MTKKVLITGPGFNQNHRDALVDAGLSVVHLETESAEAIVKSIADANAFVLGGDERLTERILKQGNQLEIISFVGTGITEFVDCAYATNRGIVLRNTPGVMASAVAEHTLGFILGLQRGLFKHNDIAKRNRVGIFDSTKSVSASTIGIVGLGAVGLELVKFLQPLRCKIVYWSRNRKIDYESQFGVEYVDLEALFERADCIVLAAALVAETRGLVGAELLGRITKPIHLINTAAAELVDPNALKLAFDNGKVQSAAFDGYWREPLPELTNDSYGLLHYPDSKFIITPHVAAKTTETWPLMMDEAVKNVANFYKVVGL